MITGEVGLCKWSLRFDRVSEISDDLEFLVHLCYLIKETDNIDTSFIYAEVYCQI